MRLRDEGPVAPDALNALWMQTARPSEIVLVGRRQPLPRTEAGSDSLFAVPVGRGTWAAALNRAVARTQAPFVAFADTRAVAAPERLERQRQFLLQQSGFALIGGASMVLTGSGISARRGFVDPDPGRLLAALLHENPFVFETVMVARTCFDALGGFDPRLRRGADHDLWLRIGLHAGLGVLPDVVSSQLSGGAQADADGQAEWMLSERRRRRHVDRVVASHPRGRWLLEEALSRHPDDRVLWRAHAGFHRPGRHAAAPAVAADDGRGETLSLLALRCLHRWDDPRGFDALAREYARRGNMLLAYLCRLRALAADPGQRAVFDAAYRGWAGGVTTAGGFSRSRVSPEAAVCAVSVFIATYNRAAIIEESLRSVLRQTWTDLEVLVVDDGSTDGTADVVRSFDDPRVRCVHTPHRGVPGAAFNTAAYHARGRAFAYLGDDDVFYPDHLAQLIAAIHGSDAGLVYARQRTVYGRYEDGRFLPQLVLGVQGSADAPSHLKQGCSIPPQTVLHTRDAFVAAGGFDERLPAFEDWDLWVRLLARHRCAYVDRITAEYRRHETNLSSREPSLARLLHPLLRNYYASCRGASILARAATVQGRRTERARLFAALRSAGPAAQGVPQ